MYERPKKKEKNYKKSRKTVKKKNKIKKNEQIKNKKSIILGCFSNKKLTITHALKRPENSGW